MKDVIATSKTTSPLHRENVPGLLDDTDERVGATGVSTVLTERRIGKRVALSAQADTRPEMTNGIGEARGIVGRRLQKMKCHALRRLGSQSREAAEFFDEPRDRLWVVHVGTELMVFSSRERSKRRGGSDSRYMLYVCRPLFVGLPYSGVRLQPVLKTLSIVHWS